MHTVVSLVIGVLVMGYILKCFGVLDAEKELSIAQKALIVPAIGSVFTLMIGLLAGPPEKAFFSPLGSVLLIVLVSFGILLIGVPLAVGAIRSHEKRLGVRALLLCLLPWPIGIGGIYLSALLFGA